MRSSEYAWKSKKSDGNPRMASFGVRYRVKVPTMVNQFHVKIVWMRELYRSTVALKRTALFDAVLRSPIVKAVL